MSVQEKLKGDSFPPIISYLVECRQKKGYSLQEMATHLRVNPRYLEAIEAYDVARFPERVYVLGFVRSYAKILELEVDDCVRRFKEEVLQEETLSPVYLPKDLFPESAPSKKILFISLAGVCSIFVGYFVTHWSGPSPGNSSQALKEEVGHGIASSPQTPSLKNAIIEESALRGEEEDENAEFPQYPAGGSDELQESLQDVDTPLPDSEISPSLREPSLPASFLRFSFSEPAWVEIKNPSGEVVVEKIFQPNETYTLLTSQGHVMRTGNAGGIKIQIGEEQARPLGKRGEVLANLSLDGAYLSAYLKHH